MPAPDFPNIAGSGVPLIEESLQTSWVSEDQLLASLSASRVSAR